MTNEGCGAVTWARRDGNAGTEFGFAVAFDAAGDVYVTGTFAAGVDFGGGLLVSAGMDDVFVARFSGATGAHVWSRRIGGLGLDTVGDIEVAGDAVIVGGRYENFPTFGMPFPRGSGTFVMSLATADGAERWVHVTNEDVLYTNDGVSALAIDAAGDVLVTGEFAGTIDFGGGARTGIVSTVQTPYLLKLSGTTGTYLWDYVHDTGRDHYALDVAPSVAGRVAWLLTIDPLSRAFDNPSCIQPYGTGTTDVVLASMIDSIAPRCAWSRLFRATIDESPQAAALTSGPGNEVIVAGWYSGSLDMGGGALTSGPNGAMFLARYHPMTGAHVWSRRHLGSAHPFAMAADGLGNVALGGTLTTPVDFGTGTIAPVTMGMGGDAFQARFRISDAAAIGAARYGGPQGEFVFGIDATPAGALAMTGRMELTGDFGPFTLTSAGSTDVFTMRVAP
jgi:hypothetical protein